jgi:hypothetical protein
MTYPQAVHKTTSYASLTAARESFGLRAIHPRPEGRGFSRKIWVTARKEGELSRGTAWWIAKVPALSTVAVYRAQAYSV